MQLAEHTRPAPGTNAIVSSSGLFQQRRLSQGGPGLSNIPEIENGMIMPRPSYDVVGILKSSDEPYYGPECEALGLTAHNMWPGNPWLEYVAKHPKLSKMIPFTLPSRRNMRNRSAGGGSYRPKESSSNQAKPTFRNAPQHLNRGNRLPASSSLPPPPGLHIQPNYPSYRPFGSAAPPISRGNERYAVHQPVLPHHSYIPSGGYGNQYAYGPPQYAAFDHRSQQSVHQGPNAENTHYPLYSAGPAASSQVVRPLVDASKNAFYSAPGAPKQLLHHNFNEAREHDTAMWKAREAVNTGFNQPRS